MHNLGKTANRGKPEARNHRLSLKLPINKQSIATAFSKTQIQVSPNRAARRDKFKRVRREQRLLTPNEIAWRDRLGDHEFEFQPVEVKWISDPGLITVDGTNYDQKPEFVQRLFGPQNKTVQFIRTVRLTP